MTRDELLELPNKTRLRFGGEVWELIGVDDIGAMICREGKSSLQDTVLVEPDDWSGFELAVRPWNEGDRARVSSLVEYEGHLGIVVRVGTEDVGLQLDDGPELTLGHRDLVHEEPPAPDPALMGDRDLGAPAWKAIHERLERIEALQEQILQHLTRGAC